MFSTADCLLSGWVQLHSFIIHSLPERNDYENILDGLYFVQSSSLQSSNFL